MRTERYRRRRLGPASVQIRWPVPACADVLLRGPKTWFPRLNGHNVGVVAACIAGLTVHKRVVVEVGTATRTTTWAVIPLQWTATFPSRLFPKMAGRIEIAQVDSHTSRLTISGRYEPPLGRLGKRADAAFMSRLADSTARRLASSIASLIDAALVSRSEPGAQR